MIYKTNISIGVAGKLSKTVAGLAVLMLCGAGQQALAQQGAECLACHTGLPATANNVIPDDIVDEVPVSAACDYSSADLFDGWGWNPILSESCPPLNNVNNRPPENSSCDYSNASQFGGWGWDPVAGESCPPSENNAEPHAAFPICSATLYDADGDGFGWENQATCIVTSASEPAPTFINRETGNTVELVRAEWDANADIANKVIQCDLYYYDTYYNQYQKEPVPFRSGASLNNQVFPSYRFNHASLPLTAPFMGLISEVAYVDGSTITPTSFASTPYWTTDDGRYLGPTVMQSPYVELVVRDNGTRGIRTWHESRFDTALDLSFSGNRVQKDGFFECWDTSGYDFTPTGRSSNSNNQTTVSNNQCDYSNASQFGGWGWNPVTSQSCAPQQQTQNMAPPSDCDYSNAAMFDGWGWNPVTALSCPPR